MEVELSIIIVNWHSADYVLDCIRSIYKNTRTIKYEIIVVDNASFDDCKEKLIKEYPDVIFLQSQENLGFGRANNLGAKNAKGDVLLFLNPDTEVMDQAIEHLYKNLMRIPDAGIIGCRVVGRNGSLQTSCIQSIPTVMNQLLDSEILRKLFPNSGLWGNSVLFENGIFLKEVEVVSGTCMMIKRKVFNLVGGFSSDFFMYGEDLDLCYKVRITGYRNYYISQAKIIHLGGGSSRKKHRDFSTVMMHESVNKFLKKYRGEFYSKCYRLAIMVGAIIRLFILSAIFPVCLIKKRTYRWRAILRKWYTIIRWVLGLEKWVKKYEYIEPTTKNA